VSAWENLVGLQVPSGLGAPVAANRGASGIDGVLSSAAGFAFGLNRGVTLVVGDISFLHDINGLSLLRSGEPPSSLLARLCHVTLCSSHRHAYNMRSHASRIGVTSIHPRHLGLHPLKALHALSSYSNISASKESLTQPCCYGLPQSMSQTDQEMLIKAEHEESA